VDPVLVDRILREGPALEGTEVEVTILCVDLCGFTAFSERCTPRELLQKLNEFYGIVVPIVLRHGGHANTFLGDGLISVFGAPVALADHADRGLAAAMDIEAALVEQTSDPPLAGLGLNSGRVVVGTIGGGGRVSFTAIGDAVNTAVRVEAMTRQTGDTILVTDATRRLASSATWRFAERGRVRLKGKTDRVRVFAPARAAQASAA